jgi:histidine triad (HIT) family protein
VHVLIVPKKHLVTFADFTEADGAIMTSMAAAAREAAKACGVAESGYRLLVNNGPDAHQEVMHVHMHLFGGRELGWMIRRQKSELG